MGKQNVDWWHVAFVLQKAADHSLQFLAQTGFQLEIWLFS